MKPTKPQESFTEEHRASSNLRDIILGGQDGLVNVLGLTLGLAVASGDIRIILAGGLAATFAESVSMAAVAYTSKRAEQSFYKSELAREKREIKDVPELEKEEIREIYRQKGFSGKLLEDVTEKITSKFELGLQPVETKHALRSGVVVGVAAFVGSLIPLIPFFLFTTFDLTVSEAIRISLVISALTLFIVGAYKAKTTVGDWKKSGLEIAVIGIVSAFAGYAVGLFFKIT